MDRNGPKWTETDRNRAKPTETDRNGLKPTETNRNLSKRTETDRNEPKPTEAYRNQPKPIEPIETDRKQKKFVGKAPKRTETTKPLETRSPFIKPHVATKQMHVRNHFSLYPTTVVPDWLFLRCIRGHKSCQFPTVIPRKTSICEQG